MYFDKIIFLIDDIIVKINLKINIINLLSVIDKLLLFQLIKYRQNIIDEMLFVNKILLLTNFTNRYNPSVITDRYTDKFKFVYN